MSFDKTRLTTPGPDGPDRTAVMLALEHLAFAVIVKAPGDAQLDDPTMPRVVVHVTDARVWIESTYFDTLPPGALQVGDGTDSGFDNSGNRIISVPEAWCIQFLTEDETRSIWDGVAASERLQRYAR